MELVLKKNQNKSFNASKILRKNPQYHMEVYCILANFHEEYIDMRATQKRQIADIGNSEQYVHCSLYKTNDFHFFCVAHESMYFLMKFYTHVVYIHMSMWNCFQNFLKL